MNSEELNLSPFSCVGFGEVTSSLWYLEGGFDGLALLENKEREKPHVITWKLAEEVEYGRWVLGAVLSSVQLQQFSFQHCNSF